MANFHFLVDEFIEAKFNYKSKFIIMQAPKSQERSNLLLEESLHAQIPPLSTPPFVPKQQRSTKAPTRLLSWGIYTILLMLICALIYDIKYFLIDSPAHPIAPTQRHPGINLGSPKEELEYLKTKDKQFKKAQTMNQAHLKQLKLIQLQREIIKINSALRSKQQYDNALMVSQLQRISKNPIKYWNFDQQNFKPYAPIKEASDEDSAYISKVIPPQQRTHFPKIVWMYIEENISSESNMTQVLIGNLAEYLQLQGYDFYLIGEYNFRFLMSNRHQEQLGFVLVDLWHLAYQTNLTKNLKDHTFTIKKHLISLIMLAEMGGILIDKDLILTQPLDWLEDFKSITLANNGRSQRPNIVGFYHANYTDSLEEIELQGEDKKQIHLYPPLDPYFLAVSKQGRDFISEVLQRYYVLLEFPERIKQIINQYQLSLKQLTGDDPYYQAIYFAFSWVLRRKQMQLEDAWIEGGKNSLRPLALDHYNIYAINRVYGPLKYRFLFSQINPQGIYQFLTKFDYNNLSKQFGAISYMSFIPFAYSIEEFALKAEGGEIEYKIYKNSFMGKFVYKNFIQTWITERDLINHRFWQQQGIVWNALPKNIWVYIEQNRSLVKQLCINNIIESALASGFQVNIIKPSNLQKYLPVQVLTSIKTALQNMRLIVANQTLENVWIQILKLAIIKEHGGIWLDLPIFTLQSFDWILDIHHNHDVINKMSRLPKILLFYHAIESGFPLSCQSMCNMIDILSFSTSFIAAEVGNDLISLWLKQFMDNLALKETGLQGKLLDFNITYKSMETGADLSRITLHSILMARNRRFGNLGKHQYWAMAQYSIWAINSFTGLDKLKQYTNFDVGFDANNIYLWSLPASKLASLLGEFQYLLHLSQKSEIFLNHQLLQLSHLHINPQSLASLHLMDYELLETLMNNKTVGAFQLFNQTKIDEWQLNDDKLL